jgi:hypothetical protein
MRCLLVLVAATAAVSTAAAQAAPQGESHAVIALPGQITWGPSPPSLPAGAQAAVLEGDPAKAGPFTLRIRAPDGYRIPPHSHPGIEHVTVLSGTFRVGMGDKFDASKLTDLPKGNLRGVNARHPSFCPDQGRDGAPAARHRPLEHCLCQSSR